MSKLNAFASAEFKARERINAALERLFQVPHWTPAQGALLVAGIVAIPGCQEIPSEATSLIDPTTRATQRQLADAEKILNELRELWDEREETKKYLAPDAQIEVMDFLFSCYNVCEDFPESWRPSFCSYIFAYCEWEPNPFSIPFATLGMVKYGVLLDGAYEFREKKVENDENPGEMPHSEFIGLILKLIRKKGRVRVSYKEALVKAVQKSNSADAAGVWPELLKIANEKGHGLSTSGAEPLYWNNNRLSPLTRESVGVLLGRLANEVRGNSTEPA